MGASLLLQGFASCRLLGSHPSCVRDEDCTLQFISVADTGGQVLGIFKVRDGGKEEEADDRRTAIIFKSEKFSMSLP